LVPHRSLLLLSPLDEIGLAGEGGWMTGGWKEAVASPYRL